MKNPLSEVAWFDQFVILLIDFDKISYDVVSGRHQITPPKIVIKMTPQKFYILKRSLTESWLCS